MNIEKLIIGFVCFIFVAVLAERVPIDKNLGTFLGTLERHAPSPNDIVFLLDESGSIGAERFEHVKLFTELIVRRLPVSSEYSRVAIVTFATDPRIHVNYIRDSLGNNMCTLIRSIKHIDYAAEWTHTKEAMIEARNIFRSARKNSTKIIILLTDGQSNDGHSPVSVAVELKRNGVIIFSVGVADVNVEEVRDVASSLDHMYILSNFSYIETVNTYLISDTIEVSWDYAEDISLCNTYCDSGSDCCDSNAKCYCGTKGGQYECVCNAGYFGSGHKHKCHLCPKGTYKTKASKQPCTPCPENFTTDAEGSSSFSDCKCLTGYRRHGNFCKPIECASLSAPEGGVLIPSHCDVTYGTQCTFKCNEGFCPYSCNVTHALSGTKDLPWHHLPTQRRACLESGKWSGEDFYCETVRCPILEHPSNGSHNCSGQDFTFGTTCQFRCDKGFELLGSESRTCLSNSSWTGIRSKCIGILCEPLKTNNLLFVKPKKCNLEKRPYRSICQYYCAKGYNLTSPTNADGTNECLADKTWSQTGHKISCKDISYPNIKCPKSISVETDPGRPTAMVEWMLPTASDNIYVSYVEIKQPLDIAKPPHAFPINTTKVVYEATDASGLKSTCSFSVTVHDKEPPKVMYCPSDIEVYHDKKELIPVTWKEPVFEDNSGKYFTISNKKNGSEFSWTDKTTSNIVHYNATDPSGNTASCKFVVKVKPYPCPYYDPPANGVLTCDTWADGRLCSVFCHEGYEFVGNKNAHKIYMCDQRVRRGKSVSKWIAFPSSGQSPKDFKVPWPDCSKIRNPKAVNMSVEISYPVQYCTEEVIREMKEKFIKTLMLESQDERIFKMICPTDKGCNPENVNITCSEALSRVKRDVYDFKTYNVESLHHSTSDSRYRRFLQPDVHPVLKISFNFELHTNGSNITEEKANEENIVDKLNNESNSLLNYLNEKVSGNIKDVYNVTSVPDPQMNYNIIAVCSIGQIKVRNSCLNCPAGTFKDDITESCIECPTATYQDKENSLACLPCPKGYTTYNIMSKSLDDCKAPCLPGTYSDTTFEPCLACPLHTYQEHSGRKDCLKCSHGLYTARVGSNSSNDCVSPCNHGSYSDSGLEPCIVCPIGSYQDEVQQSYCKTCTAGTSTVTSGSTSINECKEIDICQDFHPCPNLSTCIQTENGYKCLCPEGLLGPHCEINVDECASDPCINGGTCVDDIGNYVCNCPEGFSGHQCEININDCPQDICQNGGTCVDMINDYACDCLAGYSGQYCEINIFECASNPCQNGGICFDKLNSYRCCCSTGFFGENCEQIMGPPNPCDYINCLNGGTCTADGNNSSCSCSLGFHGEFCEENIDDCSDYSCYNGGTCVDGIENATCICPLRFTGKHCEEDADTEYILSFMKQTTSNYVKLETYNVMYAVTVSFFMRSNFKNEKSRATPVSFSYYNKKDKKLVDNALTLLDINRIVLFLHGELIHTGYVANKDSNWHHYAVTWESSKGDWFFYVDGEVIAKGFQVGEKKFFWPGVFILGQEQDSSGGTFSVSEAFVGNITEFNVWDQYMSKDQIKELSSSCGFVGNVIPWFTALRHISGSVVVEKDEICSDIGVCNGNDCNCFHSNKSSDNICSHIVLTCNPNPCVNNQSCIFNGEDFFCNCSTGFQGKYCEYDVDECLKNQGGCSHGCTNDNGTYHCTCPEDMILSKDGFTCKDINFCQLNQKIFTNGESWLDSCQNCSCIRGEISCVEVLCSPIKCVPEENMVTLPGDCCPKCISWSFCLISPNSSMTSFDLSRYEFLNDCTHTLVEDCINGLFKVQFNSVKNNSQKGLIIYHECLKIEIFLSGLVLVAGETLELPFNSTSVYIDSDTHSTDIWTQSGLYMQWYANGEILIAVPAHMSKHMCGLCGNFQEYNEIKPGKYNFYGTSDEEDCYILGEDYTDNFAHDCRPASALLTIILIILHFVFGDHLRQFCI